MPEIVIKLLPLVLLLGIIVLCLQRGQAERRPGEPLPRDDHRLWLGGFLYNNPDDPGLFVPKRYGRGFTVNIARPLGKALMLGLLLLPFLMVLLRTMAR